MSLALTLVVTQAAPALANSKATANKVAATADWSAVQAIPAGERIVVRMKDGKRYGGSFESASDLVIVLRRDGKDMSIERERIWRVSRKGGKSRANGALWGAAIGGGGGAAIGGGIYESANGDFVESFVPVVALIGAGIGAGIGALFGKGKKDVTIYEAP